MQRYFYSKFVLGVFATSLNACSATDDEAEDAHGSVQLSLSEIPEDVQCLRVMFEGKSSNVRHLPLTAGETAQFTLERVPTGLVHVDAQAFGKRCDSVSSSTTPSFVMESPTAVYVQPNHLAPVRISLVRNGRISVEVDFVAPEKAKAQPTVLAVIGDTPYGAEQVANFPRLIDAINGDRDVHAVVHVGDIKNGSTRCDTDHFDLVSEYFSAFAMPLVYTPGDNEWTDCHRANNGAYDPLERLEVLRRIFFPNPGVTLGEPMPVLSQASIPGHADFVENQLWLQSSVVFATVHVVGSANGFAPWFGTDTTGTRFDDPDRRTAEVEARIDAALDWIDRSFELAQTEEAPGVAVFMQADTFAGTTQGFIEVTRMLAEKARHFEKPVLLVQGDSHRYLVDQPLAVPSAAYGIEEPVPNLTRVVVEGETTTEWLKLQIDPSAPVLFTWENQHL